MIYYRIALVCFFVLTLEQAYLSYTVILKDIEWHIGTLFVSIVSMFVFPVHSGVMLDNVNQQI